MANTRHDEQLDFDYIPRFYPDGPDVSLPVSTPHPLTAAQKTWRAKRMDETADRQAQTPIEPDAEALRLMPAWKKAHDLERIRKIQHEHFIGHGARIVIQELPIDPPTA